MHVCVNFSFEVFFFKIKIRDKKYIYFLFGDTCFKVVGSVGFVLVE